MNIKRGFYRDPGSEGGGGGGGTAAGGSPASGSGAPGSSAAPGGSQGGGAPQGDFVSRADFDRVVSQISEIGTGFKSFRDDITSRFGARPGENQDRNSIPTSEPDIRRYENTAEGMQKYLADMINFRAGNLLNDHVKKQNETLTKQQATARKHSLLQAHIARMADAQKRYPDFETVISKAPGEIPAGQNGQPDILSDILDSDHSADIQYHISKNPGDFYKLIHAYSQSEREGHRMLARLESKFEAEAAERKRLAKQARVGVSAEADGEFEPGESDDSKHEDLARGAWGLKAKKKG